MKKDEKIYLYDGSFPNLINLINYLINAKIKPGNIKEEYIYQPNLIDNTIKLKLSKQNIKIDQNIFKLIYYAYLSANENKELIIYYFLLNYYKFGIKVIYLRNLKCVNMIYKISKHVSNETHKLKGFLRFRLINNEFLYAEMEPVNNILELVTKHFINRLKNEYFMIHDKKRNLISFYNQKNYYIRNESEINIQDFNISSEEILYQKMWKSFFNIIAIKERTNKKVQQNFMPKRYWRYLTEMREDND